MAVNKVSRLSGVKEAKAAYKALPATVRRIYAAEVVGPTADAVAAGARRRAVGSSGRA